MAKRKFKWPLSRRIPKEIQAAARKHARHIGEIVLAWTALQDSLFCLFWIVSTDHRYEDYPKSYAIWHMFQSDKSQRNMILEVARANTKLPKKLLAHIKWAVARTEDLSSFRNDAVHTPIKIRPYSSSPTVLVPMPNPVSARKTAVERLMKKPTAKVWHSVRGDLVILAKFCDAIYSRIVVAGFSGPWPNRPHLQNVPRSSRKRRKNIGRGTTMLPPRT